MGKFSYRDLEGSPGTPLVNGVPLEPLPAAKATRDRSKLGYVAGVVICVGILAWLLVVVVHGATGANPLDMIVGGLLALLLGLVVIAVWSGTAAGRWRKVIVAIVGLLMASSPSTMALATGIGILMAIVSVVCRSGLGLSVILINKSSPNFVTLTSLSRRSKLTEE